MLNGKTEKIKGWIFDIQKYAINNGPGIRTTIFLKGCPLRCMWCHNPEGFEMKQEMAWNENKCSKCLKCVAACPNHAVKMIGNKIFTDSNLCTLCGICEEVCPNGARETFGKMVDVDEIYLKAAEDKAYYDASGGGVTCSGGEPLMQWEFVATFFKKCKDSGIQTALDTSGFGEWSAFEQVLHYTDLILFDLKQMDREKHIAYTGVDSKIIIENLKKADQTDIPIYIRYPVIPGYTDDEKSILDAARLIKSLKHVVQTEFLPYHTLGIPKYQMLNKSYELEDILPQNEEQIKRLNKVFLSAE